LLASGLKAARNKAGLSANGAAGLIAVRGVACTRGTLLAWERGAGCTSREPFASDLSVIANVYGCKVGEFFRQASLVEGNGKPALVTNGKPHQEIDGQAGFVHLRPAHENDGHADDGHKSNGTSAEPRAASGRFAPQ